MRQVTNIAQRYHLLEENVEAVVEFASLITEDERPLVVCGSCRNRNTKSCPFPNKSELTRPACLTDYKRICKRT